MTNTNPPNNANQSTQHELPTQTETYTRDNKMLSVSSCAEQADHGRPHIKETPALSKTCAGVGEVSGYMLKSQRDIRTVVAQSEIQEKHRTHVLLRNSIHSIQGVTLPATI